MSVPAVHVPMVDIPEKQRGLGSLKAVDPGKPDGELRIAVSAKHAARVRAHQAKRCFQDHGLSTTRRSKNNTALALADIK